jgi:hypothetical protein
MLSITTTPSCDVHRNKKRANNLKIRPTKLTHACNNTHIMEGSSLYSYLISRINLHFNYSISQNVKQSKVVGELFMETRGT